jgi:hypothetical protein
MRRNGISGVHASTPVPGADCANDDDDDQGEEDERNQEQESRHYELVLANAEGRGGMQAPKDDNQAPADLRVLAGTDRAKEVDQIASDDCAVIQLCAAKKVHDITVSCAINVDVAKEYDDVAGHFSVGANITEKAHGIVDRMIR